MKQYYRFIPFSAVDCPIDNCAIVFVKGCNHQPRCSWCYNIDLLENCKNSDLDWDYKKIKESIKDLIYINSATGKQFRTVDWVIFSGGEALDTSSPLELVLLMKFCKKLGFKIGLYTNGHNHIFLKLLIKLKLISFINIDVKPIDTFHSISVPWMSYNQLSSDHDITKSLKIIADSKIDYRLNTTVTEKDIYSVNIMRDYLEDVFNKPLDIKPAADNNINCWQITPVKTDVPTFGNLNHEYNLTAEGNKYIWSSLNNKKRSLIYDYFR